MSGEKITAQKFRWIKSEKAGDIVELDKKDDNWTYFQGGSRIANELLEEYLEPVAEGMPLGAGEPKIEPTKEKKETPISILFNKQKKNDKVKLTINLPIEVPKKSIYDIIEASFDEKEVVEELEAFIRTQLDQDKMQKMVDKSIQSLIKEKYKGTGTTKR
tara:strand:+ start:326 stop:805 length:480 start_codon:yes stop_codon:yes gene_type:complete